MLTGVARHKGDVLFDVNHQVEPGGKLSDGIVALKAKAMAGINAYIAAHNLRSDDVDVMEEDGGGEDGAEGGDGTAAARGGQKKGTKRKHP
ncbi:hypothetical protein Rsub_06094 [Raphidocelis subcapitata]|uniref:Uncharacterized protein n=1 Tax=Raphidocelis subcapitata TaxID=307507 RepID=A0A2V0P4C5_9CHLO|nr:hypothetical protein Rsub_06094 [Raphidocelis subcapitata]|eukprot:GBF93762.1 hypothetical protein Rsub_06094 [Raphidocelis subcapitata]